MSGSLSVAVRKIRVFAQQAASPEVLSRILADGAREALREAIESGQAPNNFVKYVDGVEGADESTVRPDGKIVYEFNYMPEIIMFALEFAKARSPRSGSNNKKRPYHRSFFLAAERGNPIREESIDYDRIESGKTYILGNTQPYSRRVDVQRDGIYGQRMRFRVPPGLFDDTAAAVNRLFGTFVRAYRVYTVLFPGQYILRTGPEKGRPVDSPAILIEPR